MTRARPIVSALISLLLVFTSVATAESRATTGPVFSLVICSDGGARTITIDGQGNPVSMAHGCLDCCLVAFDLPTITPGLTHLPRLESRLAILRDLAPQVKPTPSRPNSRAPPVPKI